MEALRASGTQEDRFHLAMLHSPIGMAIVAPQGRFLEVNDALCTILDRSREEVLAATWQDLTHPDDLQTDVALVDRLLAGEADSYQLRKRYLTPAADVVHCQLSVVAVRGNDGEVDFFISQFSDLSEVVRLQDRYRVIAENVNDVVVVGNNDGVIQWVSDSVHAVAGWEPAQLEQRPFRDLVHPDDLPVVIEGQAALRDGHTQQCEVRLRMASGAYRWMNLRIRPLFDETGAVVGRVAGWWDADEQHRALEKIAEAEDRYRTWLEAELDAHLFPEAVREDGEIVDFRIIDANPAAEEYMRRPAHEFVGHRLLELYPAHATTGLIDLYRRPVETGEPLVLEAVSMTSQVHRGDRTFDLRGIKVGEQGLSLAFRDVTERTEAAARLADSERRYRLVADNSADTVLLASEGIMRWLSPALQTLLGYAPHEWIGHRFEEFTHPEDIALAQARRTEISEGARRYTRLRMRHKDGSYHWIDINAGPVRDPDGETAGIVATLRGTDELVRIEQALADSETQARALAAKYETARDEALAASLAKTSFLSRMSHELRTPLNAVLGFAQLLAMDPLTAEQQEAVGQIRAGGRHLLDLINEVLDISRIEAGRLSLSIEPVHVSEVMGEALDLVRPLAEASAIELELAQDCEHWINGDRQRVIQILINLLGNAIKYTPAGGRVTLTCQPRVGTVGIGVTDTGPGISPQNQQLLFHAFERLGAETSGIEGTGVGLTLSLGLAQAMSGDIEVDSTEGAGSTFTLVLPAAEAHSVDEQGARGTPISVATMRPVRVLYIEDNLANARLMARICELRDHAVLVVAGTGLDGIEKAVATRPDLVLLDLHLPDMHGEQVLSTLRATDLDCRIVVVTADATKAARAAARELGADGFIAKPIEVSDVLGWLDDPDRTGGFDG